MWTHAYIYMHNNPHMTLTPHAFQRFAGGQVIGNAQCNNIYQYESICEKGEGRMKHLTHIFCHQWQVQYWLVKKNHITINKWTKHRNEFFSIIVLKIIILNHISIKIDAIFNWKLQNKNHVQPMPIFHFTQYILFSASPQFLGHCIVKLHNMIPQANCKQLSLMNEF